jgi:Heavy metal binding domain
MLAPVGMLIQLLILLHVWPATPAAALQSAAASRTVYRFHHLHVSVGDPASAMNETASRFGGSRTLLQGHGVAVRTGARYVVFDRANATTIATPPALNADPVYAEAVRWLHERGGVADPKVFAETPVALEVRPSDHVGAVAFATEDLVKATAALLSGGDVPFERTVETSRFRLPSGAAIEIVRETDLPDAFWCPMHPDIRTAHPDKCPLCGMPLVAIPPPRLGEYRLDASLTPAAPGRPGSLRLVVRDPKTNEAVRTFVEVHERLLHLFVVSRDLSRFEHLHPELRDDGAFDLRWDLPPGEYILIADFVPAAGTPQMVHRAIVSPGYRGSVFAPIPELTPGNVEQVVDGVKVRLEVGKPVAFRPLDLRFTFSDARTGAPIGDLQPFLGASGHLLVVSSDVTAAIHGHPEGNPTAGPVVAFGPLIPAPGLYKMWVQVQRAGKVITAPFVIEVKPASL